MTTTFLSRGPVLGVLLLLLVSVSCNDTKAPTVPSPPAIETPAAPNPGPTPTPVPNGPFPGTGTYVFFASRTGREPYSATQASRYVLNDDGTFVLEFPTIQGFVVRGRYKEIDRRITFDFDWNAQSAGATAVFDGTRMTVTYNFYMSMSDFEDAIYVLK